MQSIDQTSISRFHEIDKDQLKILHHLTQLLNRAEYTENLIEESLDLVVKIVSAERGVFVRYEEEERSFAVIAGRNVNRETIIDLSSFSSGILQEVIDKREPCLYHDVQSDPNLSQFESVMIHRIKSVIGVPIFYEEQIWGVILVDSRENRKAFTEENLLFLRFFSNLVSLSLNKIIRFEELEKENRQLKNRLGEDEQQIPGMVGEGKAMKNLAALIQRVAPSDATVLILGESGTGKDLVARAIHSLSDRSEHAYLAQFCGSIPETLLESELFGYKKGAFSGATADKKGLFEVADKGVFFLDEIGDIPMSLQAKLLRVLQNQEIIRLGDTHVKKVNVRIIAATNKNLRQMAQNREFREDLFYRLNVFPIHVPPLRERKEDIPLLVKHFMQKYGSPGLVAHRESLKKMRDYHWPGNVRQLENVIQRALILCDTEKLMPDHIMLEDAVNNNPKLFKGSLKDFERQLLLDRLEQFEGNRTLTAKSLGVSVRWVQLKLKEIGNGNS
ncbi:MAG: sigma 54-interacting transcriptional regulator [Calditrichota bacterium]